MDFTFFKVPLWDKRVLQIFILDDKITQLHKDFKIINNDSVFLPCIIDVSVLYVCII